MRALSAPSLVALCENVQSNCAISDARYARDYSLCVYLLRMREFYRWRYDIPLMQAVNIDLVGDWISETEVHWDDIEENDFVPIKIKGDQFDPFDSTSINAQLQSTGLIYSAGYGRLGQPHFVLAELENEQHETAMSCYECGKELARDSITLPAMAQSSTIYIRHDSIKRHIGQMFDEWTLQKKDGPMGRIVEHFQLDSPSTFNEQLNQASNQLSQLYRVHERGEVAAGQVLSETFDQLMQSVTGTPNEFYLRAVRDILADCLETWPYLITRPSEIELDFWLSSIVGARLEFLNATGITTNLNNGGESNARLNRLADRLYPEQQRWLFIAEQLVHQFKNNPAAVDIHAQTLDLIKQQGNNIA